MLLWGCMTFQAGATDVELQMRYVLPTCTLTFDNGKSSLEYPLGILATGSQKKHEPFMVYVDCSGDTPVKTAITARVVSGLNGLESVVQPNNDSVRMQVAGTPGVDINSPELWLQTKDKGKVKLTGLENDAFCINEKSTTGSSQNKCQLTPETYIPAKSARGKFGVVMQFNVEYPL